MPPVWKKLRLKPGMRIYVAGAPSGYEATLADLPEGMSR
jgi:hypothetical protein